MIENSGRNVLQLRRRDVDDESGPDQSPPSIPTIITISTTNQRDSSTREGKFTLAKTTFSVSRQKGKLKINIKLS